MIEEYPWGALEPLSRASHRFASRARRSLGASLRRLEQSLAALLERPCSLIVRGTRVIHEHGPATVRLASSQATLALRAEPALSAYLAAQILRRPEPLVRPDEPASPALAGLFAALAIETARHAGFVEPLRWVHESPATAGRSILAIDVTLLLEDRAYALAVEANVAPFVAAGPAESAAASLLRLGELPLTLPLVVSCLWLETADLVALLRGSAILLGERPGLLADGSGQAWLLATGAELGLAVEVRNDGRLVVGEVVQARLSMDRDESDDSNERNVADVALEAPVVVRIELGGVTLSAREWAELRPGDVIESSHRLAEPVLLTVAGREVARGELVNVEGQLGVRISRLVGARE